MARLPPQLPLNAPPHEQDVIVVSVHEGRSVVRFIGRLFQGELRGVLQGGDVYQYPGPTLHGPAESRVTRTGLRHLNLDPYDCTWNDLEHEPASIKRQVSAVQQEEIQHLVHHARQANIARMATGVGHAPHVDPKVGRVLELKTLSKDGILGNLGLHETVAAYTGSKGGTRRRRRRRKTRK